MVKGGGWRVDSPRFGFSPDQMCGMLGMVDGIGEIFTLCRTKLVVSILSIHIFGINNGGAGGNIPTSTSASA